jgi:excisionase family DNA binding protein
VKDVTPVPKRQLVDIKEAAAYAGLSVHTLYTMVSQRRVPYVKVGRLTKFDLTLLNEWIDEHTVMPARPKALVG